VAGLRAGAFFATLAFEGTALRVGLVTCFFAGLALAADFPVTLKAFLAGAFTAETFLPIDFGRADLGLRVLLLVAAFGVERRDAARLIPFVTGLLI